MTDDVIFKFSVYDNESSGKVYWDADMKIKSAADGLKILRMLQAAQTDIMENSWFSGHLVSRLGG